MAQTHLTRVTFADAAIGTMSLPSVNLNVFTNVTSGDARHCLVAEAVQSFFSCFSRPEIGFNVKTRIFIDPNPHRDNYESWIDAIRKGLPDLPFEIVQTNGLIDGFWRSLDLSESRYAVQLEHDFVFLKNRIPHSLADIIAEMEAEDINFVRFNKRRNVRVGYDLFLERDESKQLPLSRISGRSNNPQIIDIPYYRAVLNSTPEVREVGLEGGFCRHAGGGYLYGEPGWPKTVQHLDGRRIRTKDGLARAIWLLREHGLGIFRNR